VKVRAAGDAALLVEAGAGPPVPARLAAAIAAMRLPGIGDIVPGAETVLVVTEPGRSDRGRADLGALAEKLRQVVLPDADVTDARSETPGAPVAEIPVRYDGPDLAEVAELTGLSVADVIARHSAAGYEVGWLGFSPGFGYLTGLDPALHVPRRDSPRTSVPAGSVAIAGPLAAVYPSASPGGWRLLGRTTARLWDPGREPPAALGPGRRVRFRPVDELDEAGDIFPGGTRARGEAPRDVRSVIEVVRPGPLATVVDLGRPGYAHLGVPRSGAADAGSLRLANRLVGNPEDAAALELTLGGAALRFRETAWVALTGARVTARLRAADRLLAGDQLRAGDQPRAGDHSGMGVPFAVPAGTALTVSTPAAGVRSYLAVRGGITVPAVLGSRSSDQLSGLGPAPLRPGDVLPVGAASGYSPIVADIAPLPGPAPGPAELRIVAGPRDDWFAAGALEALCATVYEVTSDSDRTGLRLSGPSRPRAREGELPSEGMVTGALQVPPDGQPILFLADHPVTGGYPVIAVVVSADIGLAAQLRPGDEARFRLVPSPIRPVVT
jgi:KipI family sensor histidine kinase inhibitor